MEICKRITRLKKNKCGYVLEANVGLLNQSNE